MILIIFSPARVHGGTTLLMGRIAAEAALHHGIKIQLIDYADGKTAEYLERRGVAFEHWKYHAGEQVIIRGGTHFLINLLTAKWIGTLIMLPPEIKVLLWSTHPNDGFKYLPLSNLFNSVSIRARRLVAKTLHPTYSKRVGRFLVAAAENNGLLWMDEDNRQTNALIYSVRLKGEVVPLFTERPISTWKFKGQPLRIAWLGRLADAKAEPLAAIIRELDRMGASNEIHEFIVIGDGAQADIPRDAANNCVALKPSFAGHVAQDKLDDFLLANVDLVIGHGTAILEAAKLGIPSLLVDGFYFKPSVGQLRFEWFQGCPPYYLGKLSYEAGEFTGCSLAECLREWRASSAALGEGAQQQWQRFHSPEGVVEKFLAVATSCTFTGQAFLDVGARRLDPHGKIIEWIKNTLRDSQ